MKLLPPNAQAVSLVFTERRFGPFGGFGLLKRAKI